MKIVRLALTAAISVAFAVAQDTDDRICSRGGCPARNNLAPSIAAGDSLHFKNNWFLTGDYVVGGVGVRGTGVNGFATGVIPIAGVPAHADIIAAYLYWETLGNSPNGTGQNATFMPPRGQASAIVGTSLGTAASPCWQPFLNNITVYRADVLQYFPRDLDGRQLVNGNHVVTLADSGDILTAPSTEGASLVIVWRLPGMPYKAIVLYDGAFTLGPANQNFSQTIVGFYQASSVSPQAKITHIVGDGQAPRNLNEVLFNGTILPGGFNVFTGAQGPLWDNPTFDVSALVPANASQVTTSSPLLGNEEQPGDCLTWGAVVFSTTVQDTDGDGIPDTVEINGMTDPADGSFVNFPAMGANPNVKDIFVQLDYMVAGDHTHQPKPVALNRVIAAFAAAPGGPINVHFTVGNAIPEAIPTAWKKDFNPIKLASFPNNMRNFGRYGLFAHQQALYPTSSGVSDLPGGDFEITFGNWHHTDTPGCVWPNCDNMQGTVDEQTGTLMHEMGHGFFLKHGGGDYLPNCKPNFESVMNYSFQTTGLMDAAGIVHWDYSRQTLPTLDDNALNESAGLGAMTYRTRWFALPNIIDTILAITQNRGCTGVSATPVVRKDSLGTSGPLDWNNDPFFAPQPIDAAPVPVDTDGDLDSTGALMYDPPFAGFNDWSGADFQQTNGRVNQANGEVANGELANGELGNGELANGELANGTGPELQFEVASVQHPPAPSGLVARVAPGLVRLAWTPLQLRIINQYNIYRFDPSNPQGAAKIGQVAGNPPPGSFTDTTAVRGTTYGYFVTSQDQYGICPNPAPTCTIAQSSNSNVIQVTAQ